MKKVMVFGGLGLVLLAAAGGAYFMANRGDREDADADAGSDWAPARAAEPEKAKPQPKAAPHGGRADQDDGEIVVAKQIHVVNIPGGKGFLRCQFSFLVRDQDLGKVMASDQPTAESEEAKSIVLGILQTLSADGMNDPANHETLRTYIMDSLNDRFGGSPSADRTLPPRQKEPIKDVFITEWAIQR